MMANHWILEILSVKFLMTKQEYGGTVITMKSLNLVVFQKVCILERVTKKYEEESNVWIRQNTVGGLYHNKRPYIIQLYFL